MKKSLKFILWIVSIYHIFLGILGIFFRDQVVWAAKNFFNFNLTMTPEIHWIMAPFATYILIFGGFMLLPALNPSKYKNVIYVGVVLFGIRVLQRIFFVFTAQDELINVTNSVQNAFHIGLVAALGLSMYILAKKTD